MEKENNQNCYCLALDESQWDEQDLNWTGKQFFIVKTKRWFYTLRKNENIGQKILDGYKEIARRGYGVIPRGMILHKEGMFTGEILLEIKKGSIDDPDVKTFISYVHTKVYIGPREDLFTVIKTFDFTPLNVYRLYLSCLVCEPNLNKQKTLLIGEKKYY